MIYDGPLQIPPHLSVPLFRVLFLFLFFYVFYFIVTDLLDTLRCMGVCVNRHFDPRSTFVFCKVYIIKKMVTKVFMTAI